MKFIIFVSIFFLSQLLTAQPNYQVDSLVVKISNDTVYVWDYNAWEQCAFELDYTVEVEDSIITITQIDTASDATTCYGYHNFVVPVVGLSEGNYRADIYRDCLYQDVRFIKSISFDYIISGISASKTNPAEFRLHNAYPNPFNPTTKISYTIPEEGFVSLKVYNSIGQEISTLVYGNQSKGYYEVEFKGDQLKTGIYFYSLQFNEQIITKKLILLR
ncbi:MAG: T9SS type A sorting domain-containing protein [Melioribacteraceae bacterium]|nr:T9SS type A sorting domain-containing protein [Melioribacteraceae bacterium]MCF8353934.1 T9SS type A sorting domain-containing protein [Melioribacteraceae bacterium]MCF8392691.1 T9SS type A sorting domain-containing protein [Melioribacteraceae bacterium]MCF8417713.1 T9SS type A sorting domain-containing protein [Melioribacteraceae bacterium]